MAVIIDSTAEIDGVRLREQGSDPSAPAASHWLLYAKAAGLFIQDSGAVVTGPFGSGGGSGTTSVVPLTNGSGGSVSIGDVVYVADYAAETFDIDTGLGITPACADYIVGVVLDATIANGAVGNIAIGGYVGQINLDASSTTGNYIRVKGSASQGELLTDFPNNLTGYPAGTFGMSLGNGTTPSAIIWNMPARPQETKIVTVTGVNLNTLSATSLFLVPTGQSAVVTRVVCRNASTSLTTASWAFGYNSTTYDNVIATATHTELTGNTLFTQLFPKVGAHLGASTETFRIKPSIAQGSAATIDVDVFGFVF